MKSRAILVLNGPNLAGLGRREPAIYGNVTLESIEQRLQQTASQKGWTVESRQSNHEGILIDWIESADESFAALIINAGGLTHTSVSLHDAVRACPLPVIEVHLSNIASRESFRHHSFLSPVCIGTISGFGAESYHLALLWIISHGEQQAL